MATDKPRFSVTFTNDSFDKIQKYKTENHISTQSKAVAQLVELAIKGIEAENASKNPPGASEAAPGENHMINLYRELNQEGQEKLLDYADDLVASGKYIKSDQNKLGTAKNA